MAKNSKKPNLFAASIASRLKHGALPGEVSGFGSQAVESASAFLAALMQNWRQDEPNIGFESVVATRPFFRLGIVNNDMPFLVDSISAEVTAQGHQIHRILHPVIKVQADKAGRVTALADKAPGQSAPVSLIYLELDALEEDQQTALANAIKHVLYRVRATVSAWQSLVGEMRTDSAAAKDEEAAALLHWFGAGQMTLLGHAEFGRDGKMHAPKGLAVHEGDALLSKQARARAFEWFAKKGNEGPLLIKSNLVSMVHRRVPIDLVITLRNQGKQAARLSVHAGLWTSAALNEAPAETPVLRKMLASTQAHFGFDPTGHAGKALAHALTHLPHDVLIGLDDKQLRALAQTAMSVTDRPRPALAIAVSPLARHLEAFVWIPRDDLNTKNRLDIAEKLESTCNAPILSWSTALDDSGIALVRYTLDIRDGDPVPDVAKLNIWLQKQLRGWQPAFRELVSDANLAAQFGPAFPQAYRDQEGVTEAAQDTARFASLSDTQTYRVRIFSDSGKLHLKLYAKQPVPLSVAVPILENFGFQVLEEVPFSLAGDLGTVHDFVLSIDNAEALEALVQKPSAVEVAVEAVLAGAIENDRFNALMVDAALDAQAVLLFRALFRYLRQTGMSYGLTTVVDALRKASAISRNLAALFNALFGFQKPAKSAVQLEKDIVQGLTAVTAADDDRIFRLYRAVIKACLRTNFFADSGKEALAFKLDSAAIPGLPDPKPWREIFVYSNRVEGIHLRAGAVARGGLRWSDRRDDFRTEVLGLMKAQRVKNAVIVPTGAKGGFYPKQLPDPSVDRDAWAAEGKAAYQIFIRALLSVTDNIVDGKIVPPDGVKLHDKPDPYFVVAADKGTASFSDVANAIALERGFWLGDAFASGGSQGYDHKAMGITAKGGWVSVTRHFAEMGIDVQNDVIRTIGCGDMSGDVFGNGMLLSKTIALVAAFDHRHIFFDPDPEPAKSWEERSRLFALPRSSWMDYDAKLISKGGGVFPRSAKSIPLSPEMQSILGLDVSDAEPNQIINALLKAKADLLWFGGIGTYVKAKSESNSDVGDRANDALRVSAVDLQAKVIGEGANLGMTQSGRIEFSLEGGRCNTDFIDNSAGVDCSDNEVNIKIALNAETAAGRLAMPARNKLLAQMTDDVAALVLEDNRLQTLALSIAEREGSDALPTQIRLMEKLEAAGLLNREVEGLPNNVELTRRASDGKGLTRPELAVVMATTKLAMQDALSDSILARDLATEADLLAAFPASMQKKHRQGILGHQLRPEIIATKVANRLINRLGPVLPFELAEEEGVSLDLVTQAYVIAEAVFDLPKLWQALDRTEMPETARLALFDHAGVEIRAHMADILRHAVDGRSVAEAIAAYAPIVKQLSDKRALLLSGEAKKMADAFKQRLLAIGAPDTIATALVRLAEMDGAIGLADISRKLGADIEETTKAFSALGEALGLDWAQGVAMQMDPVDPWERLLVVGLSRDFQSMRLAFLQQRCGKRPLPFVTQWLSAQNDRVSTFRQTIDQAKMASTSAAMLAQIASQARILLAR